MGCGAGGHAAAADQLAGGGGGQDRRAARRPQRPGASGVTLSRPWYRHPSSWYRRHQEDKGCPAAQTCSPGGRPMLAAALSARRTMINGSALCAALAVTERGRPCWPDCGQTDQNADSGATGARAKDVEPSSDWPVLPLRRQLRLRRPDGPWPRKRPYVRVLDMWFDDAHGTRPDPPSEGAPR